MEISVYLKTLQNWTAFIDAVQFCYNSKKTFKSSRSIFVDSENLIEDRTSSNVNPIA